MGGGANNASWPNEAHDGNAMWFNIWKRVSVIPCTDLVKIENNIINRCGKSIKQNSTSLMIKNLNTLGIELNIIKLIQGYLQKFYS